MYNRVLRNNVIIILRLPVSQHQHLLFALDLKVFILDSFLYNTLREGADKSLARPTEEHFEGKPPR